uniref:Tudor domain-containing protein n=1 Tax=Ciona intestinalis TaxID=7719 RepID=H2XP27_CIOIN
MDKPKPFRVQVTNVDKKFHIKVNVSTLKSGSVLRALSKRKTRQTIKEEGKIKMQQDTFTYIRREAIVILKGSQHVRVKFVDDSEETDIFKLSDVMYPDDSEVTSFDELQPGAIVVAKWPMNGKRYSAVVIDPLDSGTGRRFRERKPPPKPFQAAEFDQSMKPSLLLNKLDFENIDNFNENEASMGSEFNAYVSMADRIKLKRREMML